MIIGRKESRLKRHQDMQLGRYCEEVIRKGENPVPYEAMYTLRIDNCPVSTRFRISISIWHIRS